MLWAGGYAVELTSPSFAAHFVRFTGAGLVPVSIFFLSLQLTGREEHVTRTTVGGALAILAILAALILTNPMHGLWAVQDTITNAAPGDSATIEWGPLFYIASTGLWLVAVAALGLFVHRTLEQDAESIINTASVFSLVTAIPVVTYIIYVAGITAIDVTPFTFLVSGLLMMAAMFYL